MHFVLDLTVGCISRERKIMRALKIYVGNTNKNEKKKSEKDRKNNKNEIRKN